MLNPNIVNRYLIMIYKRGKNVNGGSKGIGNCMVLQWKIRVVTCCFYSV